MEMQSSNHDSSNVQLDTANANTPRQDQLLNTLRLETISQALWKAISAADEQDASLWRMWR
ncbi:hypothetical protein [Pedobacter frigidisoli]|uniref:hypothetical protein n=1 Tax=Pedobacter frigidisoli TaxID=2530455 RepID=UPI002930E06C|nr:hypothetical protein [Pedobacter frigidisoli]